MARRDEQVETFLRLSLPGQQRSPTDEVPSLACVEMDGGRIQIRDRKAKPTLDDAPRYLTNQRSRMRYDACRREGLPIRSSHIESTIKQINRRVKGSEKFWSAGGAEALLQLSADYLSETEPLTSFWRKRQFNVTGQRHYSTAA